MIRRLTAALVFALTAGCARTRPEPILYNVDACATCRMQITDPRFGAALLTRRGKTIKFDAIECMRDYYKQAANANDVASVWVSDFRHPGTMLDANTARFVDLGPGRAPMGRGWVAVASDSDAASLGVPGPVKRWSDVQ